MSITFKINQTDCVGDSVGKHNYNIMAIDTTICNLSSTIFNDVVNILNTFNNISANSSLFNQFSNNFTTQVIQNYNIINTTVNYLSSYWDISRITPQFKYNLYTVDLSANTSSLNTTQNAFVSSTKFSVLKNNAQLYLNSYHPISSYNINSQANVTMFIHNNININDSNNNPLGIKQYNYITLNNKITPVSTPNMGYIKIDDYNANATGWQWDSVHRNFNIKGNYGTGIKSLLVDYHKDDIHLFKSFIFQFKNINNTWTYTNFISS